MVERIRWRIVIVLLLVVVGIHASFLGNCPVGRTRPSLGATVCPCLRATTTRTRLYLWWKQAPSTNGDRRQVALLRNSPNEDEEDASRTSSSNTRALKRSIWKEFLSIGGPAFIQLTAEPLAALVDTAYLGRLGPEILGGAGVAISAQYAVSKLYNDPLLRTSISLVASKDGQARSRTDTTAEETQKELSLAISSALVLALCVGCIQMIIYGIFTTAIIRTMGLTSQSSMWYSATSYMRIRALGTPAATLWLVTNGIFRGLGNTKTPLFYSLLFTLLNGIFDPLFIFTFGWGASGAAAGTSLAQYIALVPLIAALHRKTNILQSFQTPTFLSELKISLQAYVQAGGLVFFRTLGKVFAYSVCARQAALLGTVAAAAYNLTFQLGFATTQICEAVAVAVQTLVARELADATTSKHSTLPNRRKIIVRHLIHLSILLGGGIATSLSFVTYLQRHSILQGLTNNVDVFTMCLSIFTPVLVTQVLKGLAYPVNGILMGGLDWVFSMTAMWMANIICVGMIFFFSKQPGRMTLGNIWWALAAFMGTQVVTGILRYESKTGVWNVLKDDKE